MTNPTPQKTASRQVVLTPAHHQARQWFIDTGTSVAQWAREHGVSQSLVYRVLAGRDTRRGMSHDIAVLLGIKKGTLRKAVQPRKGGAA